METIESIKSQIEDTDTMAIDITELFSQSSLDDGDGPLDASTLAELELEDVTWDGPWDKHFESQRYDLGLYKDDKSRYWSVEYDEPQKGYTLRYISLSEAGARDTFCPPWV